MQLRGAGRDEVGYRDCRTRVCGVETDAKDDLVGAVEVEALRQDAADFDVVRLVCRLCGIEGVYSTISIGIVTNLACYLQRSLGHLSLMGMFS